MRSCTPSLSFALTMLLIFVCMFGEPSLAEAPDPPSSKTSPRDVAQIVLPDKPTREQVKAYIDELRAVTRIKQGVGVYVNKLPRYLAEQKLQAVPEEHIDLLASESAVYTPLGVAAGDVLSGYPAEVKRKRIIENIADNPGTIGVVATLGWAEEIRPVIIKKVLDADDTLDPAWFQVAVEIAEPKLYDKLHKLTVNHSKAMYYIEMLQTLPDYDIQRTMSAVLERVEKGNLEIESDLIHISKRRDMALMAARAGDVDALETLIHSLRELNKHCRGYYYGHHCIERMLVLGLIDYRGTNKQIKSWFEENRDELAFDHYRKRFIVTEDFE